MEDISGLVRNSNDEYNKGIKIQASNLHIMLGLQCNLMSCFYGTSLTNENKALLSEVRDVINYMLNSNDASHSNNVINLCDFIKK